jgi:hypothetical protein
VSTRLSPKYLNSVGEIIDMEGILPCNSALRYAHFVYHDRAVRIKTPDAVSSNSNESRNTVMASDTINILMLTMLIMLTHASPAAHLIAGSPMFRVSLIEQRGSAFQVIPDGGVEHYP